LIQIKQIHAITESADTTKGEKKIIEGMTIYKYILQNPYIEKYYFVFDSLEGSTLYISKWLRTSYDEYRYPFAVKNVNHGDIVQFNQWKIKILDWDEYNIMYDVLGSDDDNVTGKKMETLKYQSIVISKETADKKMKIIDENVTDSIELKGIVLEEYNKNDLFLDLNIVYDSSYKQFLLKNYKKCLDRIGPIINKKDLNFYGLVYIAGVSALELKKFEEAESYFDKLNSLVPNNPLGLFGLGVSAFYKKEYKKADIYGQRVKNQFPEFFPNEKLLLMLSNIMKTDEVLKEESLKIEMPIDIYHLDCKDIK